MKKVLLVIFLISSFPLFCDSILVMPIKSDNSFSSDERMYLQDVLSNSFFAYNIFSLIDNNVRDIALAEQNLSLSGVVSDEDLIKVGKIASAEYSTICSIRYFGNEYKALLKIMDTESATVIFSEIKGSRSKSNIEESIVRLVDDFYNYIGAGKDISRKSQSQTTENVLNDSSYYTFKLHDVFEKELLTSAKFVSDIRLYLNNEFLEIIPYKITGTKSENGIMNRIYSFEDDYYSDFNFRQLTPSVNVSIIAVLGYLSESDYSYLNRYLSNNSLKNDQIIKYGDREIGFVVQNFSLDLR